MRVLCDEGHETKNAATKNNLAICRLDAKHVWFITATSMVNRTVDLIGYLTALFKPEWRNPIGYHCLIRPCLRVSPHTGPTALERARITWQHRVTNSLHALPRILGLIQMRRTMTTVISLCPGCPPVSPGASFPLYSTTTGEFRMSREEQAEHNRMYHQYRSI